MEQRPRFIDRHGAELPHVPARPPVESAWDYLVDEHRALGVSAETHDCWWTGEPVDYDRCVEALRVERPATHASDLGML